MSCKMSGFAKKFVILCSHDKREVKKHETQRKTRKPPNFRATSGGGVHY
jgi:hypothetical protein